MPEKRNNEDKTGNVNLQDVDMEDSKETKHNVTSIKGQKRKPGKAAEPAKKKLKIEDKKVKDDEENAKENESEEEAPAPGLLDRSPEMTGTRIRKKVERLTVNSPAGMESPNRRKHELLPGKGEKLGTSPRILAQLQSAKQSDITLLHRLLYKRAGTAHEIKKNIREFSGFPFTKDDKEFESRKHTLEKNTANDLKFICKIFCLEKSGTKEAIIERILDFCLLPNPTTKPVSKKKSKKIDKAKKSKSPAPKEKNGKVVNSNKSPSKSPRKEIKSNETVEEESSSSENSSSSSSESEEAISPVPVRKTKKTPTKPVPKKEVTKEIPSKKPAPPEKSPKKSEIKVKLPFIIKEKKLIAAESNSESESDEEEEKVDDEEGKKEDDDEEDDKPLKKIVEKVKSSSEPTDKELISTIKQILKNADLGDMTMKNLCTRIYEKYPDNDLEKTKKDFIRSTAKAILGEST